MEEKNSSSVKNQDISFLVEGCATSDKSSNFLEVKAAVTLARANNAEYFDIISSYDAEHISKLFQNKNDVEKKAIILCIYLDFGKEASSSIVIKVIKEQYQSTFNDLPQWLKNLNPLTIDNFAAEVLSCDLFKNDRAVFKKFGISIEEESTKLSNEISARRFMDYVNQRPQLKTVYGLVGDFHLNMLNSQGKIIEEENNYKLIKVQLKNRTIDVKLFGGEHDTMEHYELLVKHANKDGLKLPQIVEDDELLDSMKNLLSLNLLLSSNPLSLDTQQKEKKHHESKFKNHPVFKESKQIDKTIIQLADEFDSWMKTYNHAERTDNSNLVIWLNADYGAKHLKSYGQFCQLAAELKKRGYNTEPPPKKAQYNKGVQEYLRSQEKHKEDQKQELKSILDSMSSKPKRFP